MRLKRLFEKQLRCVMDRFGVALHALLKLRECSNVCRPKGRINMKLTSLWISSIALFGLRFAAQACQELIALPPNYSLFVHLEAPLQRNALTIRHNDL